MNWKTLSSIGIIFVILFFLGGIIQAYFLIPNVVDWISPFGIGKYFTFALAIPVFIWLNIALGKIFSLRKTNRRIGLVMILSIFFFINLFLGIKTQGDMFDKETGASLQMYAKNPTTGKIHLFPSDTKFDPITGQKTAPITPEVLKEMEIMKRESWKNGGLHEMNDMYRTISN